MKRIGLLLILSVLSAGCAHKDLKAPCASVASLDTVPCDQREPVMGFAHLTSEGR